MALSELIDISPEKDNGVLKQIIKDGTGTELPPQGATVRVHYTGTLTDGTKFDSSRDRNEPFEFDLGKGSVIKAWDICVATMKKGELSMLTSTSPYAYGPRGNPPTIPPDATLKFEIEMIEWKGEDISPKKDGSIERCQIEAGDGYSAPNDGAIVDVKLIGKYEEKVFDEREVTFTLGEGSDCDIIEGIEKALEKFKQNETSRLVIKSQHAFGTKGREEWGIPADATVEYTVTLKTFEKAKESWSLDSAERVEQSKLFKEKGTVYFKATNMPLAIKMYKKVLSFLESEKETEGPLADERKSLQLSSNLNLALCHLKLEESLEARDAATAALALDERNEKALFRRGQAQLALGEPELAMKDFQAVLENEPNNKAAQSQLLVCQKKLQAQLSREKKIYASMFDKFAKNDTQKEENERRKLPDVMKTLGQWGEDERERAPGEFEKENPNILLLNSTGEFKDM